MIWLAETLIWWLWLLLGLSILESRILISRYTGIFISDKNKHELTCVIFLITLLAFWDALWFQNRSLALVVQVSSSALPWYYRMAALWGEHQGSMLLWLVGLSIWPVGSVWSRLTSSHAIQKLISNRYHTLIWLFLTYFLLIEHPFLRTWPDSPTAGIDLNPLLQNRWFLIHPPLLFLGNAGLCWLGIIAVSVDEVLDRPAISRLYRWIWIIYSAALILGGAWSYDMLGWGGFWGWDPVENMALLPWLAHTFAWHDYMNAIDSSRKNDQAKWKWLSWLAALLSVWSTVLIRSGAIDSLHSFINDPQKGLLLTLVMIFFLFLLPQKRVNFNLSDQEMESACILDRDKNQIMKSAKSAMKLSHLLFQLGFFLALLVLMLSLVLLLQSAWLPGRPIDLAKAFYQQWWYRCVGLLVLSWLFYQIGSSRNKSRWLHLIPIGLAIVAWNSWVIQGGSWLHASLAALVVWTVADQMGVAIRFNDHAKKPRSGYRVMLVHCLIFLLVVLALLQHDWGWQQEIILSQHQIYHDPLHHQSFQWQKRQYAANQEYQSQRDLIDWSHHGHKTSFIVEQRWFKRQKILQGVMAIHTSWKGDLLIIPGQWQDDHRLALRILFRPLMWLWWSALAVLLLLVAWPKQR